MKTDKNILYLNIYRVLLLTISLVTTPMVLVSVVAQISLLKTAQFIIKTIALCLTLVIFFNTNKLFKKMLHVIANNVTIRNMFCHGSHGFSLSVGASTVENVVVENSIITMSENGIHIKTHVDAGEGLIKNIAFRNITMLGQWHFTYPVSKIFLNQTFYRLQKLWDQRSAELSESSIRAAARRTPC